MEEISNQLRFSFTCSKGFQELYNNTKLENLQRLGIDRESLDIGTVSYRYFTKGFTIDDNANALNFGAGNYEAEIGKPWLKMDNVYMLHKKLIDYRRNADRILKKVFDGEIYIHDLHGLFDKVYCLGISTGLMKLEGLPFSDLRSKPAKYSSSFMSQAGELVFALSQQFIGATALSDLLVHYASFLKNEPYKTDTDIIQDIQRHIWIVNQKLRSSAQSPFTNITIYDKFLLEKIIMESAIDVDLEVVQHVQNLWMKYFGAGNDGMPFRFPITSINLQTKNNQVLDKETLEKSVKYGHWLGAFNYYAGEDTRFTSCCRLISDVNELRNKFVDSWGAGFNLGSMRVCTINIPYIAIKSIENNNDFFTCLEDTLYDTYDILKVQREMIKKKINMNFIPVFKPLEWLNEKMFFSTFGVLGMWEASELLANSTNGIDVIKMMDKIVTYIDKFSKKMSEEEFLTNVEFIPGESASYKLANAINSRFGDKYKYELLSNQIVPLDSNVTIPERIKMTGKIAKKFSGGSLLHLNFNEQIDTPQVFQKLLENSIKYNVNHLAINYVFSICKDFHGFRGDMCPICNTPKVDDVSRTVGYYTPISKWNKARQVENRQWY